MKIDRLLGITIYLLNHKKVSAQVLAQRFEVSTRTILRDIESLCMAGIPVISTYGADGGYEIQNTFKMERQIAGANDYSYIVTALKGLATAYNNNELNSTLDKVQSVSNANSSSLILDFGVLSEKKSINYKMSLLEQGIREKHTVRFSYTNSDGLLKQYEVEPIASMYKWYSWYLLCYYPKYKDYRIFKLVRMDQIEITKEQISMEHTVDQAKELWEKQADRRTYLNIKLYCNQEVRIRCMEYLNGVVEHELENGDCIITFSVPENESFWYGALLSFANKVKVLEPKELIQRIYENCQDILNTYQDV